MSTFPDPWACKGCGAVVPLGQFHTCPVAAPTAELAAQIAELRDQVAELRQRVEAALEVRP